MQVSFPSAQVGRHKNIVRWYDYLQHRADTLGNYLKVVFKKPPLNLQPPNVAPTKVSSCFDLFISSVNFSIQKILCSCVGQSTIR